MTGTDPTLSSLSLDGLAPGRQDHAEVSVDIQAHDADAIRFYRGLCDSLMQGRPVRVTFTLGRGSGPDPAGVFGEDATGEFVVLRSGGLRVRLAAERASTLIEYDDGQ